MIYYFSGTGNSKWIAEQLASKTGDLAVNMVECSIVQSIDNQTIGIVFPIHAWGVPEVILEFVKSLWVSLRLRSECAPAELRQATPWKN